MSRVRRDDAHGAGLPTSSSSGQASNFGDTRGGRLSIVIPARDEAANLPQLVDETVRVFRSAPGTPVGEASARCVRGRGRRRRLDRRDGQPSRSDDPGLPRVAPFDPGQERWAVGGDGRGVPGGPGGTGLGCSTRTSRIRRPTWRRCGMRCRAMTRPWGGGRRARIGGRGGS